MTQIERIFTKIQTAATTRGWDDHEMTVKLDEALFDHFRSKVGLSIQAASDAVQTTLEEI